LNAFRLGASTVRWSSRFHLFTLFEKCHCSECRHNCLRKSHSNYADIL